MLEFLRSIPARVGDGDPVLILLHGRGSHMGDLQGLRRALPEWVGVVTPQAPHPGSSWGYGPGWAWYRYLGEDRAESGSLRESLGALGEFLESLPRHLGFEPGSLVLGGFSQGGTTSLAYALTHPGVADAVVNLSGFLVADGVLDADPGALGSTPVFWGHGTQDPAVPHTLAVSGRRTLRERGIDLEERDYSIGHWISPNEMKDLSRWLEKVLRGGSEAGA